MKYNFNEYDTDIALVLTRYLISTGNPKAELKKVIGDGKVDGGALANLLDRAAAWAKPGLEIPSERFTEKMKENVKTALTGFSGRRYVQNMDQGFVEFLEDFYNDRL